MNASRAFTIAALLVGADVHAGVIRGRVELPAKPKAVARGRTLAVTGGVNEAVVWVDSLPPQARRRYHATRSKARITQRGRRFTPRVTAVAAGAAIRFTNRDDVYHSVFSVSPSKRFDLGKYPPRANNRITFDRPGVVNLYCDIHPGMAAFVVVLPHRVFARPSATGAFALPDLPPGTYTVRVWHPLHGERRTRVEVPARGNAFARVGF